MTTTLIKHLDERSVGFFVTFAIMHGSGPRPYRLTGYVTKAPEFFLSGYGVIHIDGESVGVHPDDPIDMELPSYNPEIDY